MSRVQMAMLNRKVSLIFLRPGEVIPGHAEISYSPAYGNEAQDQIGVRTISGTGSVAAVAVVDRVATNGTGFHPLARQ